LATKQRPLGSGIAHVVVLLLLGASLMWTVKRIPIGGAGLTHAQAQRADDPRGRAAPDRRAIFRDHPFLREEVFNSADIANGAGRLCPGNGRREISNARFVSATVTIWLIEPDVSNVEARAYPTAALPRPAPAMRPDPNKSARGGSAVR